ncbi:Tetratricopeptide repeat protein 1 [Pseudolycoriella hygida]|uniref:Tetratricopeptide repeat protein 1 n=1 Tax=Pseudolycoriella hygida TaxID=35572 RepID=A0A9Q0RUX6_9DIPT|nr:Tetratricopeptide repeat protein 1 [Pseudolycoriella hygida]
MSEKKEDSGDNSEKFEDASDVLNKSNKEIIDEIIEQQSSLNLNAEETIDSGNVEEDNFVDCIETPVPDQDEDSRRDYEQLLSEDELNANKTKADEFKKIGNDHYKNKEYLKSVESYSNGIAICPLKFSNERAILYGNRAAAYVQLSESTMAIQDCSKALDLDPKYTKVALRRAKLYEETDKLDESLEDFKHVLELDSNCTEARQAIVRLPVKINERNEKLKEEMLGKLKDLGNMILKPFGLSTNNFQMQQDPTTGSYSVNFNQKPKP